MKKTKAEMLHAARNISLIILGTLILAFGTAIFILPMNIVTGGVSGLYIVLSILLPFDFLSVDLLITIITWLLFFAGLLLLAAAAAFMTNLTL